MIAIAAIAALAGIEREHLFGSAPLDRGQRVYL
jgi:hypothetical protein